jgi:hypothetical protein
LVLECPGIVAIAYTAARVRRNAAFLLGGMMLLVALLMLSLTGEVVSRTYVIAMLTVGPLAALLGGLLHRGWRTVSSAGLVLLVMAGGVNAQEATVTDPTKTVHGEGSTRAPKELGTFAFLIGTWDGKGRTRLPDGTFAEYPVGWVGRYILDGTAIADEVHGVMPDGKPAFGITFRRYDATRATWVIEYLNVDSSFLRRQVREGVGGVTVNGKNVTVTSEAPGLSIREHYLVRDSENWVYRLDVSNDGGQSWNEGGIEFTFRRSN